MHIIIIISSSSFINIVYCIYKFAENTPEVLFVSMGLFTIIDF